VSSKAVSKRPVARRSISTVKAFDGAVYAILTDGNTLYAATSQGLLTSANSGVSWQSVEAAGPEGVYFLGNARSTVLAAGPKAMRLSTDDGKTWKPVVPPSQLSQITAVAVDGDGRLWAGGREGVFLSEDNGASWQPLSGLYVGDANSIFYDQRSQRILITSNGPNTLAFAVHLPEKKVSFWDTGWNLRFVRPVGDHLLAVTPFDGVVVQPRMVESTVAAH
jgi:ligand-binding sensor domain-containing protein